MAQRAQTPREERANSLSHALGLVAAVVGIPFLVLNAAQRGNATDVVGAAVFGATVALLYLTSMLYHAATSAERKRWLRKLDHSAIFLLIAGTYTPFTLGVLGGGWGWSLFGVVWGLAAVGIAHTLVAGVQWPSLRVAVYVAMGWLMLIAIRPLWASMPASGIALIAAGGVAYTAGVGFYGAPRMRYAHLLWHVCVLLGTTFHFFAVLRYAV